MTQTTFDKFFVPIFFIAILIFGSVWVFKVVYEMNHPEFNKKEVTFNVVGIVNTTNSSIVSIHFECIKWCVNQIEDGTQAQYRCYDECAKLGK